MEIAPNTPTIVQVLYTFKYAYTILSDGTIIVAQEIQPGVYENTRYLEKN